MGGEGNKENLKEKKRGGLRRVLLPVLLVLVLAGCGTAYFLYSQSVGYFVTDNARVTAKMYNIGPVKSGPIIEWNVAAGDYVRKDQILGAQDVLPYITSPVEGLVVKNDAAVGQSVNVGAQLAVVADVADMYIGVNIEETDIAGIRVGQEAEVSIDAYSGKKFRGLVTEIDRSTQTYFSNSFSLSTSGTYTKVTQLVPVKVYIADPPDSLAFGMNATVRINLKGGRVLAGDKGALPLVAAFKAGGENSKTTYTGSLEASDMIRVSPDVTGRVDAVHVKMGGHVKEGDVLFTLDSADAELQLNQAKAAYQVAQVAFANSRAQRSDGASVIPAQVARDDAQRAYDREKELYDEGASSKNALDAARSRLETAEAQLSAARTQSDSGVDSTAAQLDSAKAAVDIAARRLENCVVRAPMEGEALSVSVSVGDMASPQSAALVLINTAKMKLRVSVTESRISQVKADMPVDLYLPSLGVSLAGCKVSRVAPGVNPATGLFDVEIEIDNGDGLAEAGMAAEARMFGGSTADGTSIPSQVIFVDGGDYVYVVEPVSGEERTGVLRKRPIKAETSSGGAARTRDVAAGELLALPQGAVFEDGMAVRYVLVK
ncbi:MAG: efflux RND transporter periplasmic adaptor subunit [Clostridiales Family XIII bacterium]|jgi:multidrug resistance efflux pump|nr:efflux RND transporter periplasmic adaptor subunit [Clostridiales Family XIII bacterium]